jgi:hypothetical protein
MAQFPIEIDDSQAINEAINYLLSGPSGLGQNFQGFSAYLPAYIRPSSRQPWSLPITTGLDPSIYLARPINNIVPVGGNPSNLLLVTFTTPYATVPFQFGDKLDILGVTETGSNTSLQGGGFIVYSCTTNDVTVGYDAEFLSYTWDTYVSGGTIGRDFMNYEVDTDCNGRVSVQGATTQVFVSAQLNLSWEYNCTNANDYNVKVQILRLRGFPDTTPGSNDYLFADTVLVSEKAFLKSVTPGSGTQNLEAIFTTVLDGPNLNFGYYWYILAVQFDMPQTTPPYDITIGRAITGLRSLTAQVIKQ